MSSFSRFRDILEGIKKLTGSPEHNHAHFGGDFLFVTARRNVKRGICRRPVSVCLCVCVFVCDTPVLYQND